MRSRAHAAAAALIAGGLALAGIAAGTPAGDPARGETLYVQCAACHSLARDRTGPRHCGLLGRRAGSVPGFPYSAAMRSAGIAWTRKTLDAFLANPARVVPGTTMGYAGIEEERDRRDLVAFLEWAGRQVERCGRSGPMAVHPGAPPPGQ